MNIGNFWSNENKMVIIISIVRLTSMVNLKGLLSLILEAWIRTDQN